MQQQAVQEQLQAQLTAMGLAAAPHEINLLPGYQGLLAGVARIAALDLTGLEPAYVLALPRSDAAPAEPRR